jgi:spermidine/putrescine transport system permease protein
MDRNLSKFGVLYLVIIYFFLFAPAILVVIFSFNNSKFWIFPLKGFTLKWYNELWEQPAAIEAIINSLLVAFPTMVLSVLIGGAVALAFHKWKFRIKGLSESMMVMPLLIPNLIWGIALLILMVALNFPMGAASIILGHTLFTIPYIILLVNARFLSLDPHLEDAARSLGANTWMTFHRIILPHLLPSLLSGGVISFAISFNELILAFFLTGNGFNTLPMYIYSLINFEPSPIVNALASIVFLTATLTIVVAVLIGGREAIMLSNGKSNREENL